MDGKGIYFSSYFSFYDLSDKYSVIISFNLINCIYSYFIFSTYLFYIYRLSRQKCGMGEEGIGIQDFLVIFQTSWETCSTSFRETSTTFNKLSRLGTLILGKSFY